VEGCEAKKNRHVPETTRRTGLNKERSKKTTVTYAKSPDLLLDLFVRSMSKEFEK